MRKLAVIGIILGVCLAMGQAWAVNDWVMEMDNDQAAVVGPWNTWPAPPNNNDNTGNYYGPNYRYINCTGAGGAAGSTVTWTARTTLDNSGLYSVFIMWAQHTNRSTAVPVQVFTRAAGGALVINTTVNQEANGGKWVLLGTVNMEAGQQPRVVMTNNCANEADGAIVTADAVRFVKENIAANDILDEPGIEFAEASSRDIATELADCTAANWSRLTNFTLAPPASGLVHVTTNGIAALRTAGRFVRVCISNTNVGGEGSCQSWRPIIETDSVGGAADWWGERRYALNNVYSVTGTTTFYLVACREAGATGRLYWDDLVGVYYPTRY